MQELGGRKITDMFCELQNLTLFKNGPWVKDSEIIMQDQANWHSLTNSYLSQKCDLRKTGIHFLTYASEVVISFFLKIF